MIDFARTEPCPIRLAHTKAWKLGTREDGYLLPGPERGPRDQVAVSSLPLDPLGLNSRLQDFESLCCCL